MHGLLPIQVIAAALLLVVFIGVLFVLTRRQWTRRDKEWRVPVHHESALEAAKLLKDWCAWLATISTGAIAANGFLGARAGSSAAESAFAVIAIVAFVAAILTTATLLLALPSVIARLTRDKATLKNDFYEAQAFAWPATSMIRFTPLFRVGFIASLQYLFFALGIVSFAVHASLRLTNL